MRSRSWILLIASIVLSSLAAYAESDNFAEHAARLQVLSKQIESTEKEIHELIERKQETEDTDQVAGIIKDLAAKHAELVKTSTEYEEIRTHVRFSHPERSDTIERQYTHYKLKTLGEMETEFGIDGQLDRIKAKVLATFPIPATVKPEPKIFHAGGAMRKPASEDGDEEPVRIHLVK